MVDKLVRKAFHSKVLKKEHQADDTFVLDELGLKHGEIRADIAVMNGKIVGYEIKTEKDTLSRLPSQVVAYSEVFQKAFIITAEKHYSECLDLIPDWWGIYLIRKNKAGEIVFKKVRGGKANKSQRAFSVAQLLWKNEALEIVNDILGLNVKPRLSRQEIYKVLVDNCDVKELTQIVLKYLKKRSQWR